MGRPEPRSIFNPAFGNHLDSQRKTVFNTQLKSLEEPAGIQNAEIILHATLTLKRLQVESVQHVSNKFRKRRIQDAYAPSSVPHRRCDRTMLVDCISEFRFLQEALFPPLREVLPFVCQSEPPKAAGPVLSLWAVFLRIGQAVAAVRIDLRFPAVNVEHFGLRKSSRSRRATHRRTLVNANAVPDAAFSSRNANGPQ
jgi:hypothetical protein